MSQIEHIRVRDLMEQLQQADPSATLSVLTENGYRVDFLGLRKATTPHHYHLTCVKVEPCEAALADERDHGYMQGWSDLRDKLGVFANGEINRTTLKEFMKAHRIP